MAAAPLRAAIAFDAMTTPAPAPKLNERSPVMSSYCEEGCISLTRPGTTVMLDADMARSLAAVVTVGPSSQVLSANMADGMTVDGKVYTRGDTELVSMDGGAVVSVGQYGLVVDGDSNGELGPEDSFIAYRAQGAVGEGAVFEGTAGGKHTAASYPWDGVMVGAETLWVNQDVAVTVEGVVVSAVEAGLALSTVDGDNAGTTVEWSTITWDIVSNTAGASSTADAMSSPSSTTSNTSSSSAASTCQLGGIGRWTILGFASVLSWLVI